MTIRRSIFSPRSRSRSFSVAFTLVELLVVVVIIGLLIGSGVPAIRNMIYTSTGSLAESQLRFGLGAARDLAIRSASGDSVAVFTFEPGGRISIIPMVFVGQILDTKDPDQTVSASNTTGYRDVFAPTALAEPTQLPAGWMVRGFAPPGSIFAAGLNNVNATVQSNGWYYESPANAIGNRRINLTSDTISGSPVNKGNWIFPETAFFDPSKTEIGSGPRPNSRNTFMVRFQSGTGRIVGASPNPSIVLLPRVSIDWATANARAKLQPSSDWSGPGDWRRIDFADNLPNWARSVCSLANAADIAALIGCRSTDAVLASSVNIISLYDESRMASAIGARGLNKITGTIYGGAVTGTGTGSASTVNEVPKAPNIDLSLWPSSSPANTNAELVQMLINNYMLNALKYSDVDASAPATNIDSDARLFRLDSYFGAVVELH